jgi:hypothetical protein
MAITVDTLKFFTSERMTDNSDGGGRMTATPIVSGASNQIFDDLSDVDRAAGDVSVRKIYAAVTSADTDKYLDAGIVVFKPPTDENVSVVSFSTGSHYDERADLADRLEAYLLKSSLWHGALHENHIVGMRQIAVIQRVNTELPPVGKTLCLVQDEDLVTEQEQYVRVTKVTTVETTFTDDRGDYLRWIVRLDLSDALRFDFAGHQVSRFDNYTYTGKTRLRDTSVADAARYYGIVPLTAAAAVSDTTVEVASIYGQLVPATQFETAIIDARPASSTVIVDAGTRTVEVAQIAHTYKIPITPENLSLNYTAILLPKPAPQAVTVSYRAQGQWYVVQDVDGVNTLTGAGAGTINYATGSLSVTLLAIPDSGSAIIIAWGAGVHYSTPTLAEYDLDFPGWHLTLEHGGIEPNSVNITWMVGDDTKRAVSDDFGNLSGDGTGKIRYSTGELWFKPSALPDPSSTPVVTYRYGAQTEETFTPTKDGNGFVTLTTTDPITPNSVAVTYVTRREKVTAEKTTTMVG